ncbi:chorismate mutase [Schizosaccharomyces japonicus yFS275]|uniref:Chorismate mutase n=1 Tax=Schizosaccharomyces japonicus (strain yFS275 / FY16936) TaxID=402676 RepID=B6JVV2_SCHJY|nr:chorismate mutase [Schizosaccharomyces japonicus yFS275]EEB05503.1 chorismate mutase [Schizosaccharomyces japonicus yFS275]
MASTDSKDIPKAVSLTNIRNSLISQEDTIIFDLLERAKLKTNDLIYEKNGIPELKLPERWNSFLMFMLHEHEKPYALARRYAHPEEYPFTDDLPEPILPKLQHETVLHPNTVNVNNDILNYYIHSIVPKICEKGIDPDNYGSTAVCDISCLQSLSRRIHYGKFVAEAKYRQNPELYKKLILARDIKGIEDAIVDKKQEQRVLDRLHYKAATYGRDPAEPDKPSDRVTADVVVSIYRDYVIPMTKKVEVDYLLQRLE